MSTNPPSTPPNVDRAEVAGGIGALLLIFAPAIHRLGIDGWVNLDLTNATVLVVAVIGIGAYMLHRSGKAA